MAVYKREQMENLTPQKAGVYQMTCTWEGPSTKLSSAHLFLFKNEEYQVYYTCFLNKLPEFADEVQVEIEDDGCVDTSKFIGVTANISIEFNYGKDGKLYPKCTSFSRVTTVDEENGFQDEDHAVDVGNPF